MLNRMTCVFVSGAPHSAVILRQRSALNAICKSAIKIARVIQPTLLVSRRANRSLKFTLRSAKNISAVEIAIFTNRKNKFRMISRAVRSEN
jgi:hypothetical protein